jgi:hypothetical protein
MRQLLISSILVNLFLFAKAQSPKEIIKAYFAGYEKKDGNMVARQLAEDFTFTSPG